MVDFYKTIHIVDNECLDVWAYQSKEKNIEKDFPFFLIEIIYQYILLDFSATKHITIFRRFAKQNGHIYIKHTSQCMF